MKKVLFYLIVFWSATLTAQKPEIKVVNNSGCEALTVLVADTTIYVGKTPVTWTWIWGDGNQITLTKDTSSHTYYVPGNYIINMKVCFNNGTCDSVLINNIQVFAKPNIRFAIAPKQACSPQSICFTNNTVYNCGAKLHYTIDYGDGIIDDSTKTQFYANTFCHNYVNAGNYHVKVIMTNTCGCRGDTIYVNGVIIKQTPKAGFTAKDTIGCNNIASPTFINTTVGPPNTLYQWSFGDGGTSNVASPTHQYNGPPFNYSVKLVAINPDGNCKDSITKPAYIKINDILVDFSMNKTGVCAINDDTITFTNLTAGFVSCYWNFGDNTYSSLTNPKKRFTAPGVYPVTLAVNYVMNGFNCTKVVTKNVTVDAKPIARFVPSDTFFCGISGAINFTNTSTGAVNYLWSFTNANPLSASGVNPGTVFFGQAGKAELIAISTNGCRDTFSKFITNSGVNKIIQIDSMEGCVPLKVNYLNKSTPIKTNDSIVSFKWDLDGDGVFEITGAAGTKTYFSPCSTVVKYEVRTKLGCVTKDSVYIKHGTRKKPNLNIISTTRCRNDLLTVKYTGQLPVDEIFIDPYGVELNPIANTLITIFPPPLGPLNQTLMVTTKYCGCKDTASFQYLQNLKGPYSGFDHVVDCKQPNRLKVSFTNQSLAADSCWWYVQDSLVSKSLTGFQYNFPKRGCYMVKLLTFNIGSGCRDSLRKEICVYDSVNLEYDKRPICIDQSKFFENKSQGNLTTRWIINSSNFLFDTLTIPSGAGVLQTNVLNKGFSQKGIYNLTMISTDVNNCRDTVTVPGALIVNKVVGDLVIDSPACINNDLLVTMRIDSTFLPMGSFIFNTNGTPFNTGNINKYVTSYSTPGTKTILAIARDTVGCVLFKIKNTLILDNNSKFTKSIDSICPGQSVQFTALNLDTNVRFTWEFEDAVIASATGRITPMVVFNSLGNKLVKLIVNNIKTGCRDTSYDLVHVIQLGANFGTDKSSAFCNATTVNFIDSSKGNITKFFWDFGDGSGLKQLGKNPSNIYLYPEKYFIKLIVENPAGCRDSIVKNAFNLQGPVAKYRLTQLDSCEQAPMRLIVESKYATSIEVVTGIGAPKIYNYVPGVCGVVNAGCFDTLYYTINISGSYQPQINVTDGSCAYYVNTKPQQVNIYDRPKANFSIPVPSVCANQILPIIDSTVFKKFWYKKYLWTYGQNQLLDTGLTPIFVFPDSGVMQPVKLYTFSAPGCMDSMEKSILVHALPKIDFTLSDTCLLMPVMIQNNTNPQKLKSFRWDFGNGVKDSVKYTPSVTYGASKIYTVTLEVKDTNGCINTLAKPVKIIEPPKLISTADTIKCVEDTILIRVKGASGYRWTNGITGGYLMNDSTLVTFTNQTRDYIVELYTPGCASKQEKIKVQVHPQNSIEAWADPGLIELGSSTVLKVKTSGSFDEIKWAPALNLSCDNCTNPTATPVKTTIYTSIIYNTIGKDVCKSSDTAIVIIDERNISDIIDFSDIFTPNGDGANDRFKINLKDPNAELTDFVMRIYNRWGELVFETNDVKGFWDGFFKGQAQPSGAYMCYLYYTLKGRKSQSRMYPITLIR